MTSEVTQADSGMDGQSVERAELVWTNLPTNRPWASLPTYEKALVCHTLARLTAQSGEGCSFEEMKAEEARIMQDWRWGNLTRLGVANHLRRAGFDIRYATDKANALEGEGRSGAGEDGLARFGHHPDPATDFCVEVTELECIVTDKELGLREDEEIPLSRIARAMSFRVGGDEIAVGAKQHLREIEERAAALNARQSGEGEIERLREALAPFARLAGPINGEEGRPTYLEVISGRNGTDELQLSTYVGDGDRVEIMDAEDFRRARAALRATDDAGGAK